MQSNTLVIMNQEEYLNAIVRIIIQLSLANADLRFALAGTVRQGTSGKGKLATLTFMQVLQYSHLIGTTNMFVSPGLLTP